jgi:hypothetical protein
MIIIWSTAILVFAHGWWEQMKCQKKPGWYHFFQFNMLAYMVIGYWAQIRCEMAINYTYDTYVVGIKYLHGSYYPTGTQQDGIHDGIVHLIKWLGLQ